MLAKERFDENSKKYNIKKKKGVLSAGMCNIDTGESNSISLKERERLDKLCEKFNETKTSLTFDPFEKKINFNKRRPTKYRFNKNVKLPNAMSTNKEFECEIRKREFYSAFKKYKRITGKKNNKSMGSTNRIINLEPRLIEGVNSLQKRIKSGEIIITSTDKSSRFALLNKDQYLKSGHVHTSRDKIINWSDIRYLQSQVSSHMWWLSRIIGYSKDTGQQRMNRNILGSTVEVSEMVLLVKDHKEWSPTSGAPVPTRPVVSGSKGINTHLSELISEFLEPISTEMYSGEITSTTEALAKIDKINCDIKNNLDTPYKA